MIYINILLISIISTYLIDITKGMDIPRKLIKIATGFDLKVLKCSLCFGFWISLIAILFNGFTMALLAYILVVNAIVPFVVKDAHYRLLDGLIWLVNFKFKKNEEGK